MTLGEYLKAALKRPWRWGEWDCCRFGALWCVECGRPDPMDFLRPLYASERAALLTIERGGGLLPLWARGMADAGIPEGDEARAGDVAVLATPTEDGLGQACGIWTGARWAILQRAGIFFGPADVLMLWRP